MDSDEDDNDDGDVNGPPMQVWYATSSCNCHFSMIYSSHSSKSVQNPKLLGDNANLDRDSRRTLLACRHRASDGHELSRMNIWNLSPSFLTSDSVGGVLMFWLVSIYASTSFKSPLRRTPSLLQFILNLQDTRNMEEPLCYSTFPLPVEISLDTTQGEPPSWKDHYFVSSMAPLKPSCSSHLSSSPQFLREAEAKRLEEAGTGSSTTPQPKSLFQKTMYHSRIIPPMPDENTFCVLPKLPDASLPFPPGTTSGVTVNTVIQRRPATIAAPSTASSISANLIYPHLQPRDVSPIHFRSTHGRKQENTLTKGSIVSVWPAF